MKAELTRQKPDTPLKTEVSASGASKSLHVYKLKISITTNDAHLPTRDRIINKVGFKIVSSVKSSGYWDRHHKETKFIEKLQPSSGSKFTAEKILKHWELTTCEKVSIPLQITFYIDQITTIPKTRIMLSSSLTPLGVIRSGLLSSSNHSPISNFSSETSPLLRTVPFFPLGVPFFLPC